MYIYTRLAPSSLHHKSLPIFSFPLTLEIFSTTPNQFFDSEGNQFLPNSMKKSGLIAASVAAASATAISASSPSCKSHLPRENDYTRKTSENSASQGSSSSEKFAPRFDGLRFIETLVTAHR